MYDELPVAAQSAYAELFEAALARMMSCTVAGLPGSFSQKTIKGKQYWYYQFTPPDGKRRQVYLGPDSPEVRRLIEAPKPIVSDDAIVRLVNVAGAQRCTPVTSKHFRVLKQLALHGFFAAGGVLVGTHAFVAYGNQLGVTWGTLNQTQDLDFAHAGNNVSLGLPFDFEMDTRSAIESLSMGLLPISASPLPSGGTYLDPKEPEFRLDFLTPLSRAGGPVKSSRLNIDMQQMRFMEFSLQDVHQAVLFSRSDAVIVNIPAPERYAVHKLIVAGRREGAYQSKARKDIDQAAALIEVLSQERRSALDAAWQDAWQRGPGWRAALSTGLEMLGKRCPWVQMPIMSSDQSGPEGGPDAPIVG